VRRSSKRAAWGRIGGLTTSARLGGTAMTAPARRGFWRRFEREVDPDDRLTPSERTKRASQLLRAHMLRLAKSSAEARASRKGASSGPTFPGPTDRRD
jgi:hypothetical protein